MPKSLPRLRGALGRAPELPRATRAALAALVPSRRSAAVSAVLLLAAFSAYGAVRFTSVFAITTVRVEGATPALAREVRTALEPLVGESLLRVDGGDLLRRVEAIPAVERAAYDRAFPNTLVVSVRREVPTAVLRRGRESWLLSARARVLAKVPTGAHPRLPRIWAPAEAVAPPGVVIGHARVVGALRPLRLLPNDFPVGVRVAAAAHSTAELKLATGTVVRLGDARDLALKLAVTAAVLPELQPPSQGGPAYLDVSVPERPVAGTNPQLEASG